ncbi:MAG: hypothetical protein IT462_16370 [Planctomycetes bacterium]|nr:hypothetical protein [Planctomycetota bacterium]
MHKLKVLCGALAVLLLLTNAAIVAEDKPADPPKKKPLITLGDKVEDSVDKGCEWLKKQQNPDGIWGKLPPNPPLYSAGTPHKYEIGRTAFPIWALCKSGVFHDDPAITRGMNWLRKNYDKYCNDNNAVVYENACVVNAIEAFYISKWEGEQRKLNYEKAKAKGILRWGTEEAGAKKAKEKKVVKQLNVSTEDMNIAKKAVGELNEHYRKAYGFGGWRYRKDSTDPGPTIDISATQYAMLGYHSATRLGISYDRNILFDALGYFLDEQDKTGPKMDRVVNPDGGKPEEKKEEPKKDDEKSTASRKYNPRAEDQARGWGYGRRTPHDPNDAITYGSMTCAGICALIIIRDELEDDPKYKAKYDAKAKQVEQAIYDGLAWLVTNWSVSTNPPRQLYRLYYYLYSLERVGMLGAVDFIGGHDWYFDGAVVMLDAQKPDKNGAFWDTNTEVDPSDIYDTCYALLFLKRATDTIDRPKPVITGRD